MGTITSTTPESVDYLGRFFVVTRQIGAAGVSSVHRRPIQAGYWDAENWIATDLSAETETIRTFATDLWTPDVVAALQAAFPPKPAAVTVEAGD